MKNGIREEILHVALLAAVLVSLYYATAMSNFLLFHLLVELFAVIVGLGVFTVGFVGYTFHKVGGLAILGAVYLGIGALDLMHTLSYRGMGIMVGNDINMTAQFWLSSRAFQAVAILLALVQGRKEIHRWRVLFTVVAITALVAASVLYWGNFPVVATRKGLTSFAYLVSIVTVFLFIVSIGVLQAERRYFDPRLLFGFTLALILAAGSEVAITSWFHANASVTMIAHLLRLGSVYLIYHGIVIIGQTEPFALVLRDLKVSGEALRQQSRRAQQYLDVAAVMIVALDTSGRITLVNRRGCAVLGYRESEMVGLRWLDFFVSPDDRERARRHMEAILSNQRNVSPVDEYDVIDRQGQRHPIGWNYSLLYDDDGNSAGILSSGVDLTERRQAEEMSRRVALAGHIREAQEAERRRLARDLHDEIGQNLSALGINLSILRQQLPGDVPALARDRLNDSFSLLGQTTARVRGVMSDLRPLVLDDYGLVAALQAYGHQVSARLGIPVQVEGPEPDPRLPHAAEISLFRIAQEALANVSKYARAGRVDISVEWDDDELRMSILDDGIGFDPDTVITTDRPPGWGLTGMAERAEALGGSCQIISQPGQGTRIIVTAPRNLATAGGANRATA
jgi:PAS domain S-box-containing protein